MPPRTPCCAGRTTWACLKRLKLEGIDLYQLHAPDAKVPFADSVGALADGQRAGTIRHVGLSSVSVRQLGEARRICAVVSVQNGYNLENRSSEIVLKACEKTGYRFSAVVPGAGAALKSPKVKSLAKKYRARPDGEAIEPGGAAVLPEYSR